MLLYKLFLLRQTSVNLNRAPITNQSNESTQVQLGEPVVLIVATCRHTKEDYLHEHGQCTSNYTTEENTSISETINCQYILKEVQSTVIPVMLMNFTCL